VSTENTNNMSGTQKAAVMMLAVGEENASRLFALMDDDEIKELSQTMANLGSVSSTTVEKLIVEFADRLSATGSLVGSFESTERLLSKVLDKNRVSVIIDVMSVV
jgi:flagellar motor switch protein FliG